MVTPSIETVSDARLDDMIERIDKCRKVRDELELLAALRELRQMRGERKKVCAKCGDSGKISASDFLEHWNESCPECTGRSP